MADSAFAKSVFVSFAPEDNALGARLCSILEQGIGPSVWTRSVELKAGTLITESLDAAVSDAKWFILFISRSALSNHWIKMEANLATLRSIEDEDFAVVVVRLDDVTVPPHIQRIIKAYRVINVTNSENVDDEFLRLAIDIQDTQSTRSTARVYVDRGADSDHFAISARQNRVVFVVGWAGIGKSAFVRYSVAGKLGKNPLTVALGRGYSADAFTRQILYEAHLPQPASPQLTDEQWLSMAVDAIRERANNFFVFIDNAEEAIDPEAQLLGFLQSFLELFARSNISTHIILATTRVPEYPPSIASATDLFHLERLDDPFIRESIDLWLQGLPSRETVIAAPEMNELVAYIGGHPLAAKMVASFLKTRTPQQLLETNQARRIQLRLAEYMLRAANRRLMDIHRLILQVLAAIGEPVLVQDMLAVKDFSGFSVEDIQAARWDLADWYLIEQHGDLLFLPKFFSAYFRDQMHLQKGLFERVASDFGRYALDRALALNDELAGIRRTDANTEEAILLSSEVLRYALPSGRLLRSIGETELASKLPIEVRGTLRELVFHFYQIEQNYKQALLLAEQWLAISPNDLEVMLYRVRCYRNVGGPENLRKAETLVRQLEKRVKKRGFSARLWREKALIAERQGTIEVAKTYFRQGIDVDKFRTYPDNHIGLALIILRELDETPLSEGSYAEQARQALELLREARGISATFDRFHLGLYVEALIHAGDEETALPLLKLALEDRPDDGRLNYRMAEILRKRDALVEAEAYAVRAQKVGARKASLTLANVYYSMGVALQAEGDREGGSVKLAEALDAVNSFKPEYGNDAEVADGIACKILCAAGDYDGAETRIMKYGDSLNPYTVYEQCRVELRRAELLVAPSARADALEKLRSAIRRIEGFAQKQTVSVQLSDMLTDLRLRERDLTA